MLQHADQPNEGGRWTSLVRINRYRSWYLGRQLPKLKNNFLLRASKEADLSFLTPEEMGSTHLVAVKALEKELGGIAPMLIAGLVLISTSSCVNANLIASSRLIASAADQKMMPAVFGKRNKKNIPIQAFILMLAMEIFFTSIILKNCLLH